MLANRPFPAGADSLDSAGERDRMYFRMRWHEDVAKVFQRANIEVYSKALEASVQIYGTGEIGGIRSNHNSERGCCEQTKTQPRTVV